MLTPTNTGVENQHGGWRPERFKWNQLDQHNGLVGKKGMAGSTATGFIQ